MFTRKQVEDEIARIARMRRQAREAFDREMQKFDDDERQLLGQIEPAMRVCRWCGKQGDWPGVCMSTRDMEEKSNPACRAELTKAGGGEYTVNRIAAAQRFT